MLEEEKTFWTAGYFDKYEWPFHTPLHCIAQDKDTFWTQLFMQLLWKWLANWITLITWTWYLNEDELEHEHWTCRNEWRWTWTWNILGTNVEMADKLNQNYHLNVKPGLGLYWKYQVCPSEHEIQWTWTTMNMNFSENEIFLQQMWKWVKIKSNWSMYINIVATIVKKMTRETLEVCSDQRRRKRRKRRGEQQQQQRQQQ